MRLRDGISRALLILLPTAYLVVLAGIGALAATNILGVPLLGEAWEPKPKAWSYLGIFLQGIGTFFLAGATVVGGIFAVNRYFTDRRARLRHQEREADHRIVQLYGTLVATLETLHEHEQETAQKEALRLDVVRAARRHEALLRGLVSLRPGLASSQEAAFKRRLKELAEELEDSDGPSIAGLER